jgi:hypothetical protein
VRRIFPLGLKELLTDGQCRPRTSDSPLIPGSGQGITKRVALYGDINIGEIGASFRGSVPAGELLGLHTDEAMITPDVLNAVLPDV